MDIESETRHSNEEDDLLVRSTKRSKGSEKACTSTNAADRVSRRPSYRDTVRGTSVPSPSAVEGMEEDEDDASDDDVVEDLGDEFCFSMGMTRQEKIAARKPWRSSLIIKLVGRRIDYQYLLRRLHAMWRLQCFYLAY